MPVKRILIVDNDVLIQEAVKATLQMTTEWHIVTASSGSHGLIQAESEQPDAILLDLMMPEMDGMSTFRAMQANPAIQTIPVILLTGKAGANDSLYYQSLGLKGAIAKPFNPFDLANEIAQILDWEI
ncbi:response regulator [Pseudanabaenaceae cyanobacterium LEGE 13415]|nr:response regulator [Pseudanabaenaceae cyanobacterium LEGE 13415]